MERSLETDVLIYSLSFLRASDIACCCAVSRRMLQVASHDSLWKRLLSEDLGISRIDLSTPLSESSIKESSSCSWKNTYLDWRQCFFGYPTAHVKRMRLFWARFEAWGLRYAPHIISSLNAPCSQNQINSVEQNMESGFKLPLCFKLLYRFHDGQSIPFVKNPRNSTMPSIGWGMFGGTVFYDSFSCVRMLSIEEAVLYSAELRDIGRDTDNSQEEQHCIYSRRSGHRPLPSDHPSMTMFAVDMNLHGDIEKGYFISNDENNNDNNNSAHGHSRSTESVSVVSSREISSGYGGAVFTNTSKWSNR